MGWVDRKWFPAYPGDICTGWYRAPEGVKPVWEYKDPDFHGTRDHRPIWVMVNGKEIPWSMVAYQQGGSDCRIEPYGKAPPYCGKEDPSGTYCTYASHFCRTHVVFLFGWDDILGHFRGNRGVFGQWLKDQGIRWQPVEWALAGGAGATAPEKEREAPVEVPEPTAVEIRALLAPVVASNEKSVGLWKAGKPGPLMKAAMAAAGGKYDGKHVRKVLDDTLKADGA